MRILPLITLLGLVAALVVFGAVVAAGILGIGGPRAWLGGEASSESFAMAQDIPTSFGVVAVEHAEKVPGLTAKQLGGMTHGIQSNIPPDKVQVQAAVVMTNTTNHTVDYSPDQFTLISDKNDDPFHVAHSTVPAGTLQPDASIEATMSFIAPRDGSKLQIAFKDPRSSEPILIDLGRTDTTPANAFDGYHHH